VWPEKCELYSYDGLVWPKDGLTDKCAQLIRETLNHNGVEADVTRSSVEFKYAGRDANRWLIEILKKIAPYVGTAKGEVVCELTAEDGDPRFEFYTFEGGSLFVQRGHIRREFRVPVD